jgi:hypothetical protein
MDFGQTTKEELAKEEAQMIAEYLDRYRPRPYRQVFYPPASGEWKVDASYSEAFFNSAKLLLDGITSGDLLDGLYGVAAAYLCRHYLELAIKYALFHSRWLKTETQNAADDEVVPIEPKHTLEMLWKKLMKELKERVPSALASGLDLNFVGEFVAEFHRIDKPGWRFRYPRKQIAVSPSSEPYPSALGINFDSLLFNLKRAYDVLDTLDGRLVDQYGENEEWESIQNSF